MRDGNAESACASDAQALHDAARVLRGGGIVAHATEGVWGLACDPFDARAVQRVLAAKARPASQGLIVICADAEGFAAELGALDAALAARLRASWPGPTTYLVPNARFGEHITGGRDTVAVRVPGHAQARALARTFGGPLVSTSANRSGEPPCLAAEAVTAALGDAIDCVLPGEIGARGGPSRIIDARSGKTLR